MATIEDKEFGLINIRKSASSSSIKATVAPGGQLRILVPSYVPMFVVKRMIASSRSSLRKLLATRPALTLTDGMQIGKSHSLHVRSGEVRSLRRVSNQLILTIRPNESLHDAVVVGEVRNELQAILRREAKHHLPRRLEYLANTYDFSYTSVRFTHASSRWGSCSTKKAISLNIALMNLPFELIDYVLLHELCHTKHLNHSQAFWSEVERVDPSYKTHRKQLKAYSPGV